MVRQSFSGVGPSLPSSGERNRSNNHNGPVFNLKVVLLDQDCCSIPRGRERTNLSNAGRILELPLPRGMQELDTTRAIMDAFHINARYILNFYNKYCQILQYELRYILHSITL